VKDLGHHLEMKMTAVIGLRGLQRGDNFDLYSNIDNAGNSDDIMYTAGGWQYFLKLKHTERSSKKKLTKGVLVKLLLKYFKSYCDIKHGDSFKEVTIDNWHFTIYTNKELAPELLKHKRRQREVDIFFKASEKGYVFNFLPDDDKKLTSVHF
jgi:hypothetical protein